MGFGYFWRTLDGSGGADSGASVFLLAGVPAIVVAAIVSLLAHFAVGAAKSLITIRSWWSSGLEMTLVGLIEGVVTYVIGVGIGRFA